MAAAAPTSEGRVETIRPAVPWSGVATTPTIDTTTTTTAAVWPSPGHQAERDAEDRQDDQRPDDQGGLVVLAERPMAKSLTQGGTLSIT